MAEISKAPFDRDLELAIIDATGVHAVAFPCGRLAAGIRAETKERIEVRPTHWRPWATDEDHQLSAILLFAILPACNI